MDLRDAPAQALAYHRRSHHRTAPIEACDRCRRALDRCLAKVHLDWDGAEAAANEVNEREDYQEPVIRYWCRWCGQYHIGHARTAADLKRIRKLARRWRTRVSELESPSE